MKPTDKHKDYIKANRRGSRDAELENSSGWKAVRKIHRSKRTYTRKDKHQSGKSPDFFLPNRSQPYGPKRLSGESFSAILLGL